MGRAAQHTTRHGGQRASSNVERGAGGDDRGANVDADSRGTREDEGRKRREEAGGAAGGKGEGRTRWWREGEPAREYGEGERRRGSGKRGEPAAPVGDCGPRGYVGWKRTRGTDVRGESDGGRETYQGGRR